MGTAGFAVLAILIVVSQASAEETAEEPTCVPGFMSDMMIIKVNRKHLGQGMRLGRVGFTDCTDISRFLFYSVDNRFTIQRDGTLMLKRPVVLHEGHLDILIKLTDMRGHKMTVTVRVVHSGHHPEQQHGHHHEQQHGHHHEHHNGSQHGQHHKHQPGHRHENQQNVEQHHGDKKHQNEQQQLPEEAPTNNTEATAEPQVPVLLFPKSSKGLSRRKRDWVIPPINVVENDRRQYPLKVSQIRSNEDKSKKIFYGITGPGADQDPVGIFFIDRNNGNLYVTKPLDREFKDKYEFQAYAVAEDSGQAEEPMEMVVNVIDQNDNRPVFNKTTFIGEVPEASPIDFEIIQVGATDRDQPLTDNSDLSYRILEQDPEMPSDAMFSINPKTGWIRVNKTGLDREKYPNYTLTVQVADMMGEGLTAEAKVILTVSDSNDNAPVFSQSTATAEPQVPVLLFPKSSKGLSRRKRDWVIPPINVVENDRRQYPLKVSQIRSNEDKSKKIFYGITGPGADQDPVGIFFVDRDNGNLYVTKPLDREFKDKYEFQAYAVAEGSGQAEEPMEMVVNVIDQNDNRPVFNKTTFIGEVPEASPIDFEIIQVGATDRDQPLTDNSDLSYRILEQDPEMPSDAMFTINPKTGWIRVNKTGLDREKYPNYTLTVQVADMMGEGLTAEAKVILTVLDSNDNAPVFSQSTATAEPQAPVLPQDE